MATNRKRDATPPPTMPGHRHGAIPRAEPREVDPGAARKRSEAPTLPPPKATEKTSGMRAKRRTMPAPAATVDEVVADMSNDPRREDEDEDER